MSVLGFWLVNPTEKICRCLRFKNWSWIKWNYLWRDS